MKFAFRLSPPAYIAAVNLKSEPQLEGGALASHTLVLALFAAVPAFAAEKLRIATTGGYPPFTYVDDAREIAGFDVDVALALCTELGAECEIVLEEWERLIPELRAGSLDAIAASMSITEKRRELVSFTERYYSNAVRFVARRRANQCRTSCRSMSEIGRPAKCGRSRLRRYFRFT